MTSISGLFEIHITIIGEDGGIDTFQEACKDLGVKPVLIELPYGETQKQLMTSSWTNGSEELAIRQAKTLAGSLHKKGFVVTRVKVESAASNEGVPIDVPPADPTLYFEFHIKLRVEDEERLQRLIAPYKGHLSRNSLKGEPKNKFVTVRLYDVGRTKALEVLEELLRDLRSHDEKVLAVHREFAVYDTNVGLDNGWIEKLNQ